MSGPSDAANRRGIRPPADVNPRTDPPLDFPDREFGRLTPDDYAALGFLGGLEVHQQLHTRRKLFCRCPAGRYTERCDGEVLRHMRPTLSELGEYDGTALMEFKTKKEIVYLLERGSVCTYEMDDTPPFPIDPEAVDIALGFAQLFNLNLVSELHVMRKQYLDGSIPTGFQRTAMVGLTGRIPFRVPDLGVDRELAIRQLSLEEDSCREVSDVGHRVTFRTDRLGMPLTEAVTEPEFRTPHEMQAGGRLLALTVRATGQVRRGPGAARQDVNVSVAGGRRIEIKGVDNHRHLPRLVHIEAFRQLNLLRIRAELAKRDVTAEAFALPDTGRPWDVSPLVVDLTSKLGGAWAGDDGPMTVVAVRLPGFAGLLAHRTQPGLGFAHELAERVRVIACPAHAGFLFHSDDEAAGLPASAWRWARSAAGAERDDAVVLLRALERDAATGAREVLIRAAEATVGIPAETRQARPDGTTGFERILPGADRMYPDTDTPPLPVPDGTVERIRVMLPETPWARMDRYLALGLRPTAAHRLATAPWASLFDAAAPRAGELARRLAASLAKRMPYHARQGRAVTPGSAGGVLRAALEAMVEGTLRVEALDRIVDHAAREPGRDPEAILRPYREGAGDDLARAVDRVVASAAALPGRARDRLLRWAMGEAMPGLLGRAHPDDVRRRLTDRLNAVTPGARR